MADLGGDFRVLLTANADPYGGSMYKTRFARYTIASQC